MTAGRITNPILSSRNKLKLGLFGLNVSMGCSMVQMPSTLKAEWGESVRIASKADALAFDAIIPVAQWGDGPVRGGTAFATARRRAACVIWPNSSPVRLQERSEAIHSSSRDDGLPWTCGPRNDEQTQINGRQGDRPCVQLRE